MPERDDRAHRLFREKRALAKRERNNTSRAFFFGHLLRAAVPADQVASCSFHSFRIGFASALLAANCPYDMIQALARWRSDKSVAIYARLNPEDYAGWVAKALQQDTTPTTTVRLPAIDAHDAVATFPIARGHFRDAAAEHGTEPEDMDE